MKKVIINADDFGYSSGVNSGIIKSFQDGILSSTTLMANMPGCLEAIQLTKENPGLGIGGHLVLTCGKSLTDTLTLTRDTHVFYHLNEYHEHRKFMDQEEIFNEWCAQIDFLLARDVHLTHLDSHHHVHTFPENEAIVQKIAEKYQIPFRNAYRIEERLHLPYQKGISGLLDLMNYPFIRNLEKNYQEIQENCLKEITAVLNKVEDGITELMVHPAFVDEELYFGSSFNVQRVREVRILTDQKVKELFDLKKIEIVHYGQIANETVQKKGLN